MAEGLQAGRLEVPVVADLAGFARELRSRVEAAAEGLAVQVKVKIDDTGLRKRLEKAVEKASRGVTATVRVKVDRDRLRTELAGIARDVSDTDLNLPVTPDGDGDSSAGGGLRGRLRRLLQGAQEEADRNPVNVPVRLPRGRGALRMLGIGSLLTLVQPAVAALVQYGAGLTAMVSAAAPAVGVLGAIPGLIVAAGTAVAGTMIAFSGFGTAIGTIAEAEKKMAAGTKLTKSEQAGLKEALDSLSPSAAKVAREVMGLGKAWTSVRKATQEAFFSKLVGQIKPAAEAVFPLLSDAMADTAGQMGNLAARGAKFMQTGVFRQDFKTIAGTNSKVIGNITNGVANLGRASMDFLVASGPFVERVGQAGERFTAYLRSSAAAGKETGSLARFLDKAGDKAAQLGRTTRDLGKGLAGVGRAASDTGNALLDGLEGTMVRFNRWANSKAGSNAMKQFFSDAAPMFHELNALVGDFVRGLGRMATDGGVTSLIRQIRTELMPAVGSVFDALGQSIGPALISVISNVATAIASVASAGTGLGVLLTSLAGLLSAFNQIMNVIPGANAALATLIGTLLALKVVTAVSGMLGRMGTAAAGAVTSVSALGSTMRGSTATIGPSATLWQRMSGAYRTTAAESGRLSGALRGVGAANRVASSALGGMVSTLGGPLGIAIIGVTVVLGLLASRQEAAARAAAAHKERIDSLSQSLAQSGGVIDANVRAQAAQMLQDVKLADGKGKLVDVLRKADVSLGQVTDAYLEQGGTIDGLQKKLMALAEANKAWVVKGKSESYDYTEEGKRYKAAADQLGKMNGELDETRKKQAEVADAVKNAGGAGTTAYDRLSLSVQGFNDKTKSADERVDSLRRALDALSGNAESFHDAATRLNQTMLNVDDAMAGAKDQTQGWGKALIDADGMVNTSTKNGQTLNGQLKEMRDAMLSVATRAQEAAEQGLMPMNDAMTKSQSAMEQARAKAIALGESMGLSETEAKALADQMGFIPSTITTLMTTQGIPQATAEFLALKGQLENLGEGKAIRISAPTAEATAQLQALGFSVQRIPGTKEVEVTAPTGGARINIASLAADIANAPDRKNVTVSAIIEAAVGNLSSIRDQVAAMPDKTIEVQAPTQIARDALTELGYKINDVPGSKNVTVTAPTGGAIGNLNDLQTRIDNLRGRTVHITVSYDGVNSDGSAHIAGMGRWADGGILRFAQGGIHQAASRLQSFAQGSERHIAQIARPGEWRLWAEPETGGEAYIPLAPGKRKRSQQILDRVAEMFGGRVMYFGDGALRQYAQGALAVRSSNRGTGTATSRTASTPALVGGDLNLTMTGAPMSPGEAIGNAMYQLRRLRRGGAHAG
ncbi:hypothetical protein [Streptomyces subrutilus]|uniref:Phage tail protein n=1 Tax=Streptomyces subrutilus TaxID=36818 RepID=A0A1E5NXX6_9ACTN|nr:hypothetical protein [Streptomyces subrutilus]OEJ21119.1 hypothetical protein BGK67_35090 [Streptomyces subrutilus]